MISPDELQALDLLIWLRTGKHAGVQLSCNQSTISRRVEQVERLLRVELKRVQGDWHIQGNTLLLDLEREVHQMYRVLGRAPLRLEASFSAARQLLEPAHPGWISGLQEEVGHWRSLGLIKSRVIDAWIVTNVDELPPEQLTEFEIIELYRAPVWLMAARDHPLAKQTGLSKGDLDRFPSLSLPEGWYPRTAQKLKAQGLWNLPERQIRYDQACWEERTADRVTLAYASPHFRPRASHLVRLDWNLDLMTSDSLMVQRDLVNQPLIERLLENLRARSRELAQVHPELELAVD